jgi:hypothetical protein
MQAPREVRGIAPTQSWSSALNGVSGQRHTPAALYPRGRTPRYPLDRRLDGPQRWSGHKSLDENSLGIEPRSAVVRYYTDWASPAPSFNVILNFNKQLNLRLRRVQEVGLASHIGHKPFLVSAVPCSFHQTMTPLSFLSHFLRGFLPWRLHSIFMAE